MSNRRTVGRAVVYTLIGVAALATAGFVAYRAIFSRPGEAAIRYIPQDALFVATLDTNPAPHQIAAFNKLRDQLQETGVDKEVEKGLQGLFNNLPVPSLLRPHVRTNLAVAAWELPDGRTDGAFLCDIDSASEVEAILAKHGATKSGSGFTYYTFNNDQMHAAVVREYLVLASSAMALQKVYDVSEGKLPSLTGMNEYQQARKALPEDSNLMVFVAPKVFRTGGNREDEPLPPPDWLAYGIAIRDDGVLNSLQLPMSSGKSKTLQTMAGMKSIDGEGLSALPQGALAMIALGQPGEGVRIMRDLTLAAGADASAEIAATEKDLGMSMDEVINNLSGNAYIAFYPAPGGLPAAGFDMVLSIDAAGDHPTQLSTKLREVLERVSDGKMRFAQTGDLWVLTPTATKDWQTNLRQQFFGSPSMPPEALEGMPAEHQAEMRQMQQDRERESQARAKQYLTGKTLAMTTVGNRVLIGTTTNLVSRSLSTGGSQSDSMESDAMGKTVKTVLEEPSQAMFAVNVGKIVKEFEPEIRKNMTTPQERKVVDAILRDLGENSSMIITARYDGSILRAEMRAPLHIGIGAVPVMAAVLFPVFAQAKQAAQKTTGLSNIKQLAIAAILWSSDNDDKMPTAKSWAEFVKLTEPYTKNPSLYVSPNPNGAGYVYNTKLIGLDATTIEDPARTPMIWEDTPWPNGTRAVAFTDGSAKMLTPDQWAELQQHMDPRK